MSGEDSGTGAEATPNGPEGSEGAETGEITPPTANNWWQFESKEAASEWGNKLVQDRLTRERKTKLDPLQ